MQVFVQWACPGESQYRRGPTPPPTDTQYYIKTLIFKPLRVETRDTSHLQVSIYRQPFEFEKKVSPFQKLGMQGFIIYQTQKNLP